MADFDLDTGEYIIRRINRYWADLIGVVVSGALIAIAAFFGEYLYSRYPDILPFLTPNIVFGVFLLMLGIVVLMLLSAIYVYLHNYLVVTNRHLIKVQQAGLFARQTAQLGFGHIEDVRGGRKGILGFFLDYGDVEIQTAGSQENFIFRTAHHPQILADELLQYETDFNAGHMPSQPARDSTTT
jgi:ABC-type multidrug transport system fused ATPase/permease subunit